MTTGERMKIRRKEIGLSAEIVASKLGVSPATIYRYEKGDIEKVPGDVIEPLAKILHCSPAYLMGWVDEKEKPAINDDGLTEEQREIIELFDRADPEVQRAALDFLRAIERRENKMNNT